MTEEKCACVECRIRAALSEGGNPAAPFEIDINEAVKAMGIVLSELLAHHSSKSAKMFAAALLDHRKRWLKHPRVMAQQPPQGHA
ncbi:hypothetical protein ACVWXN_003435 [Bradyrhizobium sp. i1.4.4]